MKKIFIVVLAAIGMVACMNEQITELPTGNEIAFDNAFIDNATRAELTAANLGEFKVWGYISGLGDADNQSVALFEGTEVTNASGAWQYGGGARYWAPSEWHHFQAVAPLTAAVEAVSVAESGKVTAIDYTVDGESDLIYAAYEKQAKDAGQDNGPVSFIFNHLLSKVNFAFTNGFGTNDGITLQVKDITMTVPAEATYTIDGTWSDPTGTTTLDFAAGEQIAANAADSRAPKFVIPADNTKTYDITFKVDVYFNGVLINKDVAKSSTVAGVAFEQGKAYNLTATIDSESLNMESIEFTVGTVEGWVTGGDTTIGTAAVGTAAALQDALNNPDITNIVLTGNIDLTETLTFGTPASRAAIINGRDITIDGNDATLTYAGSNARIIDVTSDAQGMDLTVKNLTIINNAGKWIERIINYNTNGTLTLDGVKILNAEGSTSNYAINLPASSDNAKVIIKDSEIWAGANALNIWGEKVVANITNSKLYVVDANSAEGYAVISLNNNGVDNAAHNSVVNIEGGEVKVVYEGEGETNPSSAIRDATNGSVINISESTVVVGERKIPVVNVVYEGYNEFYSLTSVQAAIDKVQADNNGTVKLFKDLELTEPLTVKAGHPVTIDLAGYVLSGVNNVGQGSLIYVENGATLNVKDSSNAQSGKITYAQGTSNVGWTVDLEGTLNLYSGVIELTGEWSIGYAVDVRPNSWGSEYQQPTTLNIYGGKLISSDGAVRVASSSADQYQNVSANFNMEGGEIDAVYDGLFVQQSNNHYDVLNVNISAGTINADLYPVRLYGPVAASKTGDSSITISGGNFSKVVLENKTALVEGLLYIGGGIDAESIYHTNINITGGQFIGGEALPAYAKLALIPIATADAFRDALANADVSEIILAPGATFEGTYNMRGGVTIKGNGALVGAINLNGADNVTLKEIKFDAANAVWSNNGTDNVQPANIFSGGQGVYNGSMDVVIDGCTFVGTFADGGGSIAFTDQKRTSGASGNITIKNCVFEQLGGYFFIYAYYSGNNGYMNIENNDFNTKCYNPIYLGQYQSSVPVVVKGNHFAEFSTFSQAFYLQEHSSGLYGVSYDAEAAATNTFGK